VYIKFECRLQFQLHDIKREVKAWADRYGVQYTHKTIKYNHRVGFNNEQHFSLFSMTWNPEDIEIRPWLKYQIVNIQNERY
jgi:hypothetical protein